MTKMRRKDEVLLSGDRGKVEVFVLGRFLCTHSPSTRHANSLVWKKNIVPWTDSDTMYRLYEVDPDADTLLIVPHLTEPFAPWDRVEQQQQQHLQQASSTITSSNTTSLSPPASPTGRPPITPSHDADAYSSVYAGILRGTARPTNIYARIASSPSLPPTPSPPRPETRIKVSSQHLRLASRPFRDRFRHLDRVDAAASACSDDGRVHVALPGRGPHDPAAAILVMDMLHGRGRKVPRAVELETLARVAVVVDALRALEAVEAYADRWFDALLPPPLGGRGGSPAVGGDEYGRDLVLWLYASYVFRRADVFQRVTRTAVLRSDGPVRSLGLNIREGIISESIGNGRLVTWDPRLYWKQERSMTRDSGWSGRRWNSSRTPLTPCRRTNHPVNWAVVPSSLARSSRRSAGASFSGLNPRSPTPASAWLESPRPWKRHRLR